MALQNLLQFQQRTIFRDGLFTFQPEQQFHIHGRRGNAKRIQGHRSFYISVDSAKVYVSILSPSPEATVFQGLVHAQAFVQREVTKALSMRVAPHLVFMLDHSLKKQAEIDRLLAQSKGTPDE